MYYCKNHRPIYCNKDIGKSAILMAKVNVKNLGEFQIETVNIKVVDNN